MKKHIATLCHTSNCCPVVTVDDSAPAEQAVAISDDRGGTVTMSKGELADFVKKAKEGVFDKI